jgi:AraC-like DNA-binding protein
MTLHAAFFAIDCIGMFVAALLAAGLLAVQPHSAAARIAAFITLVSAGYIVFSRTMFSGWIPDAFRMAPGDPMILTLQVLMNATPGAFMLLCFSLFDESNSRFPRWLMALFALQVALEDLIPYLFGVTTHPSLVPTMTDSNIRLYLIYEALPAVLQIGFIGAALYWTVKDWRADLVEIRRLQRIVLMVVIGVNFVSYTLLTRLVLDPNDILLMYVHEGYTAFNVLTNATVLVFLIRSGFMAQSITPPAPDARVGSEPSIDLDYAAFDAAMKARIYHEAGLSIATLAARLKIPEYRLRRLINTKLAYRNFNHMLHAYRVAEASEALADPAQRRLPILSIALSVGYQSINPFNRAFRDLKGTTPSAFRQHALASTAGVVDEDGESQA